MKKRFSRFTCKHHRK